jgi:hypothetical protein
MSEGEEMCNFQIDIGYESKYEEHFRRPPACHTQSPDFSFPDPPFSSTKKNDRNDIIEIVLKVALNTIKPTNQIETNKPKSNQNN